MTGIKTDSLNANIGIRGELIPHKISCEVSGTMNQTKANDASTDRYFFNTNSRISYVICNSLWRVKNPTLALVGRYSKTRDVVFDTETSETTVLFVVAGTLAYSN